MKQLINLLIVCCFAVSILSSMALAGYSLYALHAVSNAAAFTSIALSVVCFGMAVATAQQFNPGH
jgi:hypothetical protein